VVEHDLRYEVPLAETGTCDEPIHHTIYSYLGAKIIDPGHSDNSNLMGRILATDIAARMPPLGRSVVDPVGAEVVRRWIARMPACE
jgi:hypothetical protein